MKGKQISFYLEDMPYCKKCETCHIEYRDCSGPACCCCSSYSEEYRYMDGAMYHVSWCKLRQIKVDLENTACSKLDMKSVFDI